MLRNWPWMLLLSALLALSVALILSCTPVVISLPSLASLSSILAKHAPWASTSPTAFIMGGGHGHGYRTVAYFVDWAIYGRKHRPQDLPVENLTHVLYAFANVRPDSGEVYLTDTWSDIDIHWEGDSWNESGTNLFGCLKQLNLLKRRNRNLKVLLSIGGWTYSPNFAQPASTAQGRSTFASTAVDLVRNLGFDGLDIDWEYPKTSAEATDLVALLQACRAALDQYARDSAPGRHFELTIASSAGPDKYNLMDLHAIDKCLDFWNLMAYDFAGSWGAHAGHQANLFSCAAHGPPCTPFSADRAIKDYVTRGVPAHKIVLGMPLYGRAFQGTDGPGAPYSGVGEGTWENGVHDYKKLPLEGSEVRFDQDAHASYCYHPATRTMVSYDTVDMARRKAIYICQNGLGGAMWWESSADKTGPESIIANVAGVLREGGGLQWEENCIDYPASKYENLRNGFPST